MIRTRKVLLGILLTRLERMVMLALSASAIGKRRKEKKRKTNLGRLPELLPNRLPLARVVVLDSLHESCALHQKKIISIIAQCVLYFSEAPYLVLCKFGIVHILYRPCEKRAPRERPGPALCEGGGRPYLVPVLLDTSFGAGWKCLDRPHQQSPVPV